MTRARKTTKQRVAEEVLVPNGYPPNNDRGDRSSDLDEYVDSKAVDLTSNVIPFLVKQLIFSRLLLLLFQFVINRIMRDFPTDAFKGVPLKQPTPGDIVVLEVLGGLTCWDARHFLHIAEFGYVWESNLAFFPLWPWVLRIAGGAVNMLTGQLSTSTAMLLGGVIINNVLFVLNGILLFRLVLLLTANLKESILAVYVMCWCPASIFFSSLYSESLYMTFTLWGLIHLNGNGNGERSEARLIMISFVFAFAFMTRSNGLLNIGYIAFQLLMEVEMDFEIGSSIYEWMKQALMMQALRKTAILLLCFAIMSAPLRVFSWVVEDKFCHSSYQSLMHQDNRLVEIITVGAADKGDYILPGDIDNLSFCSPTSGVSLMPSYYSHVQEKYWGVSPFGYWQWRKMPFFMLAAPTLVFVFYGVINVAIKMAADKRRIELVLADKRTLLPFALHSLFLALSGLFLYNVEVSMRLIFSSSPFLYIVISRIMSEHTPHIAVPDDLMEPFLLPFLANYARVRPLHFIILSYMLVYFFVGTMMHVNWLPFV